METLTFKELIKIRDAGAGAWPTTYYPRDAAVYAQGSHPFWESIDKALPAGLPVNTTNPTLFVIGYGSSRFLNGNSGWRNHLARWTKDNQAKVLYLPLDFDEAAKDTIIGIAHECGDALQFCRFKKKSSAYTRSLEESWKDNHFIFSQDPRFMWQEGRAPRPNKPHDLSAFFNKDACFNGPDWDIYNMHIKGLQAHLTPFVVK
ncbi:MAG: hypothetical protein WCK90_06185 [archaeon]